RRAAGRARRQYLERFYAIPTGKRYALFPGKLLRSFPGIALAPLKSSAALFLHSRDISCRISPPTSFPRARSRPSG
ncbi:hypothetical protein EOA30_15805, partial [Mesorhizobium sp. M8A.F.Ca.ET.059.01.1.1]